MSAKSSWTQALRESHGCCSNLSFPYASALVADLSAGGHYSQLSQRNVVSSLPLLIVNQGSKLGICLGWDLVTKLDLGVPLKQNPKAAATGSHLNVRANRLNSKCGLVHAVARTYQSILQG